MQALVLGKIDGGYSGVDQVHAVRHVALAHVAIKCKTVYLEGEQRRHCRSFVHDVSSISRMIDVGLEIIGEAVFRIVLFNEQSAKSKFLEEINSDFDEGLADDWTVLVRALNYGPPQVGEAHPQVGGG